MARRMSRGERGMAYERYSPFGRSPKTKLPDPLSRDTFLPTIGLAIERRPLAGLRLLMT